MTSLRHLGAGQGACRALACHPSARRTSWPRDGHSNYRPGWSAYRSGPLSGRHGPFLGFFGFLGPGGTGGFGSGTVVGPKTRVFETSSSFFFSGALADPGGGIVMVMPSILGIELTGFPTVMDGLVSAAGRGLSADPGASFFVMTTFLISRFRSEAGTGGTVTEPCGAGLVGVAGCAFSAGSVFGDDACEERALASIGALASFRGAGFGAAGAGEVEATAAGLSLLWAGVEAGIALGTGALGFATDVSGTLVGGCDRAGAGVAFAGPETGGTTLLFGPGAAVELTGAGRVGAAAGAFAPTDGV